MTHQIDFRSHGMTTEWNGHWTLSEPIWRVMRGARPWLLNREPYSSHVALIKQAGFLIKGVQTVTQTGIDRGQLSRRFRSISDEDLKTSGAFIVAEKEPNGGGDPIAMTLASLLPGRTAVPMVSTPKAMTLW